MEESPANRLITIILYLLLAIAFFSTYATKSDTIDFMIGIIFLFGILAIICLYIGLYSKTNYLKTFGYVFTGSFILVFGWFILNVLIPIKKEITIINLLNLLLAHTIVFALLIPLIVLVLYMIIKWMKK